MHAPKKVVVAVLTLSLFATGCGRAASRAFNAVAAAVATEVVAEAAVEFGAEALKASSASSASFRGARLEHNVFQGGVKGIRIHLDFDIRGYSGQRCRAIAYFSGEFGDLLDQDGRFRTTSGQVSTGLDFTPSFTNAHYEDLQMFFPYSQLHLDPSKIHMIDLTFHIHCKGSGEFVGEAIETSMRYGAI